MDWKNVKDNLPQNNQVVLVSINGIYRVAKFDSIKNGFEEITTKSFFDLSERGLSVYWTEINTPVK